MKKVRVEAFLPELSSAHAHQVSEGSGSKLAVAIKRALDELLAKDAVKGRRLRSLRLTVAVVD